MIYQVGSMKYAMNTDYRQLLMKFCNSKDNGKNVKKKKRQEREIIAKMSLV
jgi:hypothetical protein